MRSGEEYTDAKTPCEIHKEFLLVSGGGGEATENKLAMPAGEEEWGRMGVNEVM